MTTALALALALVGPAVAGPNDDGTAPSESDVTAAKDAVHSKAADVTTVQARLALAQHRLEQTEIAAAQAVEAFNAARYRAQQAGRAARAAQETADEAAADLAAQRDGYVDAVTTSYRLGPSLSPLAALGGGNGVSGVLENTSLIQQASATIEDIYETYEATEVLARAADERADAAFDEAADAKAETKSARDVAEAAASDAADQTAAHAAERDQLIGELADLQDISVQVAREHQDALEEAAAEAAAQAAQEAAEQQAAEDAAEEAAEQAAEDAAQEADPEPTPDPTPTADPTPDPDPTPATPTTTPDPTPSRPRTPRR